MPRRNKKALEPELNSHRSDPHSRMPQVMSKPSSGDNVAQFDCIQQPGPKTRNSSCSTFAPIHKDPLRFGFHSIATSIYGYSICWHNVSDASLTLARMTNPLMRPYGRWRFLTYNCLIMQFVAYSLCLSSHFVPRLRRSRDFFFTTFAFPIGMLVVGSFWAIWFVAGREHIFPARIEVYYPPWLNHVTHTIIAPINLIELLSSRKQYASDRTSLLALSGYTLSYTSLLLFIRLQTGRWVYPFLNQMDPMPIGAFITGMVVFVAITFKSGKLLHDFVHGVTSVGRRLSGKRNKSADGK